MTSCICVDSDGNIGNFIYDKGLVTISKFVSLYSNPNYGTFNLLDSISPASKKLQTVGNFNINMQPGNNANVLSQIFYKYIISNIVIETAFQGQALAEAGGINNTVSMINDLINECGLVQVKIILANNNSGTNTRVFSIRSYEE
jgi:hypothetical protein